MSEWFLQIKENKLLTTFLKSDDSLFLLCSWLTSLIPTMHFHSFIKSAVCVSMSRTLAGKQIRVRIICIIKKLQSSMNPRNIPTLYWYNELKIKDHHNCVAAIPYLNIFASNCYKYFCGSQMLPRNSNYDADRKWFQSEFWALC